MFAHAISIIQAGRLVGLSVLDFNLCFSFLCFVGFGTIRKEDILCDLIHINDPTTHQSTVDRVVERFQQVYREYHVSVFDIKFIRRDQKQRRNNEACRASPTSFRPSLINVISTDTNMFFFYLSGIITRL